MMDDVNDDSLINAVKAGDLKRVRTLLSSHGMPYSKDWSGGYVLLCNATRLNYTAIAKLLITHGSTVNSNIPKNTDTPLHYAAKYGNVDIVKILLEKGANAQAKKGNGRTPLFDAINNLTDQNLQDKLKVTELLLKFGASVNVRDHFDKSPLDIAVETRCLKIVECVLEYGAEVNYATGTKGFTPLHYAVDFNLKEITSLLLNKGADADIKAADGRNPLHIAARKGYVHILEALLNHGACIQSFTLKEGYTALHFACEKGHKEAVKFLLNKDADINACINNISNKDTVVNLLLQHRAKFDNQHKNDKTKLDLTIENEYSIIVEEVLKYCRDTNQRYEDCFKAAICAYGKEKIVEALIKYGFRISRKDTNDPQLLQIAIKKKYLKIVEDLSKYRSDVNILQNSTSEGFTPLHLVVKNKQEKMAKLLIRCEADINAQDKTGKTPIFYSILNKDVNITKLLLANKANIKDNLELFIFAVIENNIEIVEAILQHDIDVNFSDESGRTALHFTALTGLETGMVFGRSFSSFNKDPFKIRGEKKGEIAKLLLSKGANVNSKAANGLTTLCAAIQNGYTNVVEALLKYNVNINSEVTYDDMIPLCFSIKRGDKKTLMMLLNKGASVNVKQRDGCTPLHIAVEIGDNEIVKILLEYGAKVNSQTLVGDTPLHLAASEDCSEIIETLLEFDADVNSRNLGDKTPLQIASEYGGKKTKEILLDYGSDINAINVRRNTYRVLSGCIRPMPRIKNFYDDNKLFEYHVLKMKSANLYLSKQNLLFSNATNENYFCNKCENEITNMKSVKIKNTNISFYDILANKSLLSKYIRNENIIQVLKSDYCETKFPIYASMIQCNFRKFLRKFELLEQVNKVLYLLFNKITQLPDECTEKIFSYLSNEDLRMVITAYKPPLY